MYITVKNQLDLELKNLLNSMFKPNHQVFHLSLMILIH